MSCVDKLRPMKFKSKKCKMKKANLKTWNINRMLKERNILKGNKKKFKIEIIKP